MFMYLTISMLLFRIYVLSYLSCLDWDEDRILGVSRWEEYKLWFKAAEAGVYRARLSNWKFIGVINES